MTNQRTVLVTAGDTYELVDDVRRITHMGTGRLGSLIADECIRRGMQVTYLCGERSQRPSLPAAQIVPITGVMELQNAMAELLERQTFDCVVHSMAVSDYTVAGVATQKTMAEETAKNITEAGKTAPENVAALVESALAQSVHTASGKLSSELEDLVIFLTKAPKVISLVKQRQPNTILVGFKLLSNVEESELVAAAQHQIHNSDSDFVLANDLATIEGDKHLGMLIDHSGIIDRPATKQQIAESIVRHVENRLEEKRTR